MKFGNDITIVLVICLLYAIFNVSGVAIIKNELRTQQLSDFRDLLHLLYNPRIIVSFVLIFISALIIMRALSISKFSVIIPISIGINFGLTILTGIMIFKDKITLYHILGFILIFAGISLIAIIESNN